MKDRFPELRRIAIAVLVLASITFGLHLVRVPSGSAANFSCESASTKEALISIPAGATGSQVAALLFKYGVTASPESYFRVAVGDPRSGRVAPGVHRLNTHLCARDALEQLLDASRIQGLINVTEGMWLSEVIPQFKSAGYSPTEINRAIRSVKLPTGFRSLEGLIFPAQYSFAESVTATEALQTMVDKGVSKIRQAGFLSGQHDFSPQQLLIIASLVQAEGNTEDFPKISRVIRNRLKIGMPLQFDSTVHYVKRSRGHVFLSTQSTLINSPYNTYRRYGLPPGPINNPGTDAMRAALSPATGDWIYFITVAPHDTRYTSSVTQFNTWKAEYRKNLKAGLFRSKK
jgi:UPF0755 protein